MSDIRFKTEHRKFTKIQRLKIWWNGVLDAIREVPDTHYSNYVQVREGEEGYDEAPFSCIESPNPARFTFRNGHYEMVNSRQ